MYIERFLFPILLTKPQFLLQVVEKYHNTYGGPASSTGKHHAAVVAQLGCCKAFLTTHTSTDSLDLNYSIHRKQHFIHIRWSSSEFFPANRSASLSWHSKRWNKSPKSPALHLSFSNSPGLPRHVLMTCASGRLRAKHADWLLPHAMLPMVG